MGVFHPSVVEIAAADGEDMYERNEALPRRITHSGGFAAVHGPEHLPFLKVAGVLDLVLVAGCKVLVKHLAQNGYLAGFHQSWL